LAGEEASGGTLASAGNEALALSEALAGEEASVGALASAGNEALALSEALAGEEALAVSAGDATCAIAGTLRTVTNSITPKVSAVVTKLR
jgi:hypothetical protein